MRPKVAGVIMLTGMAVILIAAICYHAQRPVEQAELAKKEETSARAPSQAEPRTTLKARSASVSMTQPAAATSFERDVLSPRAVAEPPSSTNRLERLQQTRDYFRALASGDHLAALQAAKGITNSVERETALMTLVTQWTHGELRSPVERAEAIAQYGLEAGLGMELAKDPETALVWANQLTTGKAREAMIRAIASAMVASDPGRAFALLAEQIPGANVDEVIASWGGKDTEAALNWANQLPDPAQRDGAIAAIRTQAPVGIGAAMKVDGGYATISDMVKGSPAELSGQINKGDRIVALAQGDGVFVDARNLSLADVVKMIRGDPGTILQLQLLGADAPAGSPPHTVTVIRDQVKFKQ